MNQRESHDLIVTSVNRGWSDKIVKGSKEAGGEGGAIVFGRVTGIHETQTLFSIPIEAEKEIVLTLVRGSETEEVLSAVVEAGKLNTPAMGIAFVIELKKVAGICHMLQWTWVCDAS